MKINWVLVSLLIIPGASPASIDIESDPCLLYKTSILVSGESSELFLCKGGRSIANYSVAFGSKGLGKTRPGDRKTPVGTYRVGQPRPSRSSYHIFIPIRVPKRIGTAVGIHGPKRFMRYFGPLSTLFDWTAGCIAMRSDSAIEEVARFARLNRNLKIHILPPANWADSILKQEMTQLETGDLIFQTSKTKVALTVFGSTGSVLTHVGLIVMRRGKPWVMEAVGPVKYTPLNQFVNRGVNHFFSNALELSSKNTKNDSWSQQHDDTLDGHMTTSFGGVTSDNIAPSLSINHTFEARKLSWLRQRKLETSIRPGIQ